jgi:DNA-binding transcriptional ArsR family regulator
MAKQDRIISEIKEILRKDTRGLTIQELALKTSVSRITVSIALAKLEGAGKIDARIIGNCKLHYLNSENGVRNEKRRT